MRSIALANQKGGVGKTTTAIHLAHGLSLRGDRVVLVDLDPQGNAAVALQGMKSDSEPAAGFREAAPGLWVVSPSSEGEPDADFVTGLRDRILTKDPHWLIADCPPRMDAWGRVGLHLCKEVIVPVQAEFLAMHGLSQIMATVSAAQGDCSLAGVLATMVDAREQVSMEVVASLRSHLGGLVYESVILRDYQLVEAASHGRSVFSYCPTSKAALCYGEFTREVTDG